MIAVLEVNTVLVDTDVFRRPQLINEPSLYDDDSCETVENSTFTVETIRGRRFVNNRGQTVCIGLSKQAEEAIGLPFEVFEKMQAEIDTLQDRLRDAEFNLNCMTTQRNESLAERNQLRSRVVGLGFKDRLKVFFTILFGTWVLQNIVGIK